MLKHREMHHHLQVHTKIARAGPWLPGACMQRERERIWSSSVCLHVEYITRGGTKSLLSHVIFVHTSMCHHGRDPIRLQC